MQVVMIILFGVFGEYGPNAAPTSNITMEAPLEGLRYSMFQDVHVMIFVGFGFLMTFLSKYGFSAVGDGG